MQHRLPIVGRLIAQEKADLAARASGNVRRARSPQSAGRAREQGLERLVEPAHAAEAGREGDFDHRQVRLMDQLLGEQHAACLRDGDGRSAQMLAKKSAQVALADAEPIGERLDIRGVERPELDQRERARHRVRCAAPGPHIGRSLRPAAQARAEACLLRRRSGGIEDDVLSAWRARGTDRTAVDSRRLHADEQSAVETGVALADRAIARVMIEIHAPSMAGNRFEV